MRYWESAARTGGVNAGASKRDRRSVAFFATLLLSGCLALSACASSGSSASQGSSGSSASSDSASSEQSASSSAASQSHLISDALSFEVEGMTWDPAILAECRAQNPDVYAWLYVPGTAVNHPVLQNAQEEDFYLNHDRYGNGSGLGELYSQPINTTTFKDPVTLIYGHTYELYSGLGEEMFSTLHNFEDRAFFDSHPYFYIFTPDMVLKYEVVSAYEYENRHVLYSNDFTNPSSVQAYFDFVTKLDSHVTDVKNIRDGIKLKAGENVLVQLATCTRPANDAYRYLVTGVLVDARPL